VKEVVPVNSSMPSGEDLQLGHELFLAVRADRFRDVARVKMHEGR
jgi:hypothetical protein